MKKSVSGTCFFHLLIRILISLEAKAQPGSQLWILRLLWILVDPVETSQSLQKCVPVPFLTFPGTKINYVTRLRKNDGSTYRQCRQLLPKRVVQLPDSLVPFFSVLQYPAFLLLTLLALLSCLVCLGIQLFLFFPFSFKSLSVESFQTGAKRSKRQKDAAGSRRGQAEWWVDGRTILQHRVTNQRRNHQGWCPSCRHRSVHTAGW